MLLLAPPASQAQAADQIQPLIRPGDSVGGAKIKSDGAFLVGTLNDTGDLLFAADSSAGGQVLARYRRGELTPLVIPGDDAPGGKWNKQVSFRLPLSMDPQGGAVFTAEVMAGHRDAFKTFRWDSPSGSSSLVPLMELPADSHVTLQEGAYTQALLNNAGDLAMAIAVGDAQGSGDAQDGIFYRGGDGQLTPVALPGQALPGGVLAAWASFPSLDNAGRIAFLARPRDDSRNLPYIWEHGAIAAISTDSLVAPRGTLLLGFTGVWVNSQNRNLLLAGHIHTLAGHFYGLYLVGDPGPGEGGSALAAAVLGQDMPGGGAFLTLQDGGVSAANEKGQHAFLATLEDGSTAAYLMHPDGTLSLILKSGTLTNLGRITNVGQGAGSSRGVALNDRGQVALVVQIAGASDALVLVSTPAS